MQRLLPSLALALSLAMGCTLSSSVSANNLNWPKSRLPIPVCIVSGKSVPGYRPDLEAIVKQAFDDWMIASGGKLQFVFVDQTDGGQGITCKWTNDRAKMSSAIEDGETVVVPDAQGIISANILLLTVPPKAMPKLTDNYARRVALHEIGHALGIAQHSSNPKDIMFGTIYPEDKACALTDGDTSALAATFSNSGASAASSTQTNAETDMATGQHAEIEGISSATGNSSKAGTPGAPGASESSNVRGLRLNNEAAEAMNTGKFDLAVTKLEEAYKLAPDNQMVGANLGMLYSNMATMAMMSRNLPKAEAYSKKSSALVEKFSTKANLFQVLRAQGLILHMSGKEAEALKVEARLKTLGVK
ncbi:hypothetical protein BH11CYA1_BH11CYA1_38920 [soil metagenome]